MQIMSRKKISKTWRVKLSISQDKLVLPVKTVRRQLISFLKSKK